MKILLFLAAIFLLAKSARIKRQTYTSGACSSCESGSKRLEAGPICCKCVSEKSKCNNNVGETQAKDQSNTNEDGPRNGLKPGLMCQADCAVFGDCSCKKLGILDIIDTRSTDEDEDEECPYGQKLCCNAVSEKIVKDLASSPSNSLEKLEFNTLEVCEEEKLAATQNFALGVTCGKRDSRVYEDADLPESYTNPGEWPWSVLIFNGDEFLGAGTLMEQNIVVTVGHKVANFTEDASKLRVRMGDWNPNERDPKEEYPAITVTVDCVKMHPKSNFPDSLNYNVAILKVGKELVEEEEPYIPVSEEPKEEKPDTPVSEEPKEEKPDTFVNDKFKEEKKSIYSFFVDLRSDDEDEDQYLDERAGLVSDLTNFDGVGGRNSKVTPSYINSVCLPQTEFQFKNFTEHCWVAAWGSDLKRQREIDLPFVQKEECERLLRPSFAIRGGDANWELHKSEICAGGHKKDTCDGEGGAPLVCLDPELDQYFAVGLVNYGFGCNHCLPAVYVNLADPEVKSFIIEAFNAYNVCA